MEIEKCQSCEKPFKVWEFKLAMPGTKEKEPISCPFCKHTIERMCNGLWKTAAISDQEQSDYLLGKPKDF